ncbi:MAG: hypothetical protein A2270_02925 [Elusimicrobia bacterium RIFOXYA12_FULL_51_18]|jgi:ABC-2 type transport system ATP-binding protein|nr:MAG: hypothetical protein A2270_02925 [Elusimicrobia bacterium RIFOXYA12_FULL_51_18]OGS29246.1 MAG: hypothetical protein A2218_04770 [Elusimicrobia bacterium RIFOXYA2_FULL_53_38]
MLAKTFDLGKTYPSGWRLALLGKTRGGTRALAGVNLTLTPGTVTGLGGPNGAGKSTLLRVLAGRLTPDTGYVTLDGLKADDSRLRKAGALAETGARSFYLRLTAEENLFFWGALYGMSRAEIRGKTDIFRELLNIREEDPAKRFDALSEGAAQKFSLARALMLRAPLLFLDEPARNLDRKSSASFFTYIKKLAAEEGAAVFYTSHDPGELARICDRVLILKDGVLTAELTGPELKKAAAAGPGKAEAAIAAACAQ